MQSELTVPIHALNRNSRFRFPDRVARLDGTAIADREDGVGDRRRDERREIHREPEKQRHLDSSSVGGRTRPFFPALVGGEEREVTLVGTVIESDWDEDGNAIAVELRTDDEVYSIASVGRGADLLSYDGQLVEVVGTVSVDDDGWNVLSVSSFTLLEPDEI
jgi:hypothetical protein